MSDLPEGWTWTTLGEACTIVGGATPKTKVDEYWGGPIAWITPNDLSTLDGIGIAKGARTLTQAGLDSASLSMLPTGSVLFSSRAPIGYVAIAEGPVCTNQGFKSVVPPAGIGSRFLYWYLKHATPLIREMASGTTFPEISKRRMHEVPIPLPPRAEQERIVAALEEHLSRLDAAEASLRTALRRTDSLAAKVADRVMTGARVSTLGELAVESRYGTNAKCSYEATGPAVIRIPNVSDGRIRVTDMKYAVDASEVADETRLIPGDLVVIRTNGSRNLIGRAAVADAANAGLSFASYLIRYRFRPDVDPQYISTVLAASSTRRVLEDLASTTAGQYNLSISKLDRVRIPLPTLDEQRRIAAEVRDSLGQVAQSRSSIESILDTGQRLRQSILAAAFSGKLVPQDPSDEPASVLLERIRTERVATKPTRRPKAKT